MKRGDDDLQRELRDHLDLEAEEQQERGLGARDAREAARRQFGNLLQVTEDTQRQRKGWRIEAIWRDLLFGVRMLARSPGLAVAAVLTLALGVGANTAIYTVVQGVLLRPLSFREPANLVRIWEREPQAGNARNVVFPGNFMAWRERTRSFERMAIFENSLANITGLAEPLAMPSVRVSKEFFEVLGVRPQIGRTLTSGDTEGVVVSDGFWRRHLGAAADVTTRRLIVNGRTHPVLGVLGPDFDLPKVKADIWQLWRVEQELAQIRGRSAQVVARLRPGVSLAQAQEDLHAVAERTAQENPGLNRGWSAGAVPLLEDATERVREPLLILLGAAGLVLLIACGNVANLLLVRALGRRREFALRLAIGASRGRLLGQLMIESLVLATLACAVGVGAAYAGVHLLLAALPAGAGLPRTGSIAIDLPVLGFAALLSVASVLVFGIAPGWFAARLDPHEELRTRGEHSHKGRTRHAFVAAEVALAVVLLAGAGLLVRSYLNLVNVEPGFTRDQILTMRIFLSPEKFSQAKNRSEYVDGLLREVRSVPGVKEAGSVHFLPLTGMVSASCFWRADRPSPEPGAEPSAQFLVVTPGYFGAMGTPIRAGRDFQTSDAFGGANVAVVNEAFVKRYYEGENPAGRQLKVCWSLRGPVQIVGVVADARQTHLNVEPKPTIFVSNTQSPMYFAQLVIRTRGDSLGYAPAVTQAIRRVDPEQAVSGVSTMETVFERSVAEPRFHMSLIVLFASMAVGLALIGVYGVAAFSARCRLGEFAVRSALGASRWDLVRLVLSESGRTALVGAAIGLMLAAWVSRALEALLFQVRPADPAALAFAAILLLVAVLVACLQPAWRASKSAPAIALRNE